MSVYPTPHISADLPNWGFKKSPFHLDKVQWMDKLTKFAVQYFITFSCIVNGNSILIDVYSVFWLFLVVLFTLPN